MKVMSHGLKLNTFVHCFNMPNFYLKIFLWEIFSVFVPVVWDACYYVWWKNKLSKRLKQKVNSYKMTLTRLYSVQLTFDLLYCRSQGRGEVCGLGLAMTHEKPKSPRNISCWTSESVAAPNTVQTEQLHSFWWGFCLSVVGNFFF